GSVYRANTNGAFTVLSSFRAGPDGAYPVGTVAPAPDGYLYGVTTRGGATDRGTLFRVREGSYEARADIGQFPALGSPSAGLIAGPDGALYGVTGPSPYGNQTIDQGAVFRITPDGETTILHRFTGFPSDGAQPAAALIVGADGNFYGTTSAGGTNDL